LNRYDGHKIKNYQFDPNNANSLPQGIVSCLEEDSDGTLWIGTENGLYVYDSENDQFKKISLDFEDVDVSYVRAMLNEGDSLLWVEVLSGHLLKFDKKKEKVIASWQHTPLWQPYYYYHDIYRDKLGVLWIGARNLHPFYLDEEANKLVYIQVGQKTGQKREEDVSCYFEDSFGKFWISGLDGVYNYNRANNYFTRFLPVSTFTIIQTENGNVWFGTGKGIYQYDKEANKLYHYDADINSPNSLPNNHINKLYEDKQGTIWIGTDDGLAMYMASNEYIKYFNHIPGNNQTASSDFVTASIVDYEGNVWIGYQDHGIDFYNPLTGRIKNYKSSKSVKNSLPSDKISCFYEDYYGDLYIGLWDGIGFTRKKKDKEQFELFTFNRTTTYEDWYYDFTEDSLGNFYIGFWGAQGLRLFDREKGVFERGLKNKFEAPFESRLITCLFSDTKNQIWMGTTRSGLHIYYPETDTSKWFYNQPELNTSFVGLTVYDILEDKEGNIWIAADSLFRYSSKTESFKVWGKGKGLTSSHIYKILEDDHGNLWLGTDKGIISFNPKWDYCLSFPELASMEMNEYLSTGSKLKDGRFLFGGKTGWVIFDPEIVLSKQGLPDIFLTELNVKGELKISNLSHVSQIDLEYHENFFSVGFSNTDLTAITKYSYRYRLNNLENNWTYIEKGKPVARYTNIQPGEYILEIQMAHNNSNWKDIKVKSIVIDIQPPFWKRNWFIIAAILIPLAILFILVRNFYQRLSTKRKMAELKELLLRAQINPHFIFNALVAIQGYIYKKEEKEAGKYLAEFSKLIRLILENTRKEYITLEKEVLMLEYYLSLQKQRYKTKFTYLIEIDPNIDLTFVKIPPMLAQPFVENAIEHGVTKLQSGGHIRIHLYIEKNKIVYIIEDNGIGRAKSLESKKSMETHESYGTEITED
jgi:ligand-binding sensor domain-containing protein